MKTMLAAVFALLLGLTFVGAPWAAGAGTAGNPAATPTAGGEMKKDDGQKAAKSGKKHHRKKHGEEKK